MRRGCPVVLACVSSIRAQAATDYAFMRRLRILWLSAILWIPSLTASREPPHPQLRSYYEPDAQLDENLYDTLIELGTTATVLLSERKTRWQACRHPDQTLGKPMTRSDMGALRKSPVAKFLPEFAFAGIEQLIEMGWLRLARTRMLNDIVRWRLMCTGHAKRMEDTSLDLKKVDLILFLNDSDSSLQPVLKQYQALIDEGLDVPAVFRTAPGPVYKYFSDAVPLLWHNFTLISYGVFYAKQDFSIPEVSYVVPFGPQRLADTLLHSPGQDNKRSILLSFFGSVNGTFCDNHLGYMRWRPIHATAQLQDSFLAHPRLYPDIKKAMDDSVVSHLFFTTSLKEQYRGTVHVEPAKSNMNHPGGVWDRLEAVEILTLLVTAAGSQYCFEPAGDGHMRHGVSDAWHMGCIPILYDTSTELCGTHFGGLLFRTRVRMEDVVKIVSRQEIIQNPQAFYLDLLASLTDGRAAHMRTQIRKLVDVTVNRMDDQHPDVLALAMGVVRYREELRRAGKWPNLPAVTPECMKNSDRPEPFDREPDWPI